MSKLTLHKAMALVLKEQPEQTASLEALLYEINHRQLFANKDGTRADKKQILYRAQKHDKYFAIIDDAGIKLIEPEKKEKPKTSFNSPSQKSNVMFMLLLGVGIFTLTFIIMSFIYW